MTPSTIQYVWPKKFYRRHLLWRGSQVATIDFEICTFRAWAFTWAGLTRKLNKKVYGS